MDGSLKDFACCSKITQNLCACLVLVCVLITQLVCALQRTALLDSSVWG